MFSFQLRLPGDSPLVTKVHADLSEADSVVICSPWIGEPNLCAALVSLSNDDIPVTVYTQLSNPGSDPNCLTQLLEGGVTVRVWGTNLAETFHPKVYFLTGEDGGIAWIGSANMTRNGMHRNIESMIRLQLEDDEVHRWTQEMERLDPYCDDLTEGMIDTYRAAMRHIADAEALMEESTSVAGFRSIAPVAVDPIAPGDSPLMRWAWNDYYMAIISDEDRKAQAEGIIDTIGTIRGVLRTRPPWTQDNLDVIFGVHDGFLGDLSRNLKPDEDHWKFPRVQEALHEICIAPMFWGSRPQDAMDGFLALTARPKIGCSTASKFGAILAPDSLCVVNKKSKERAGILAGRGDVDASSEAFAGYRSFHERIWTTPWYTSKEPSDPQERRFWCHRVAILDVFLADFMDAPEIDHP